MKGKYDEVMKHIEVTSEMRDRILNNISSINLEKTPSKPVLFHNYKKYLSIAACFVILLVGTVIIQHTLNLSNDPPIDLAIPDIVDYGTIGELSEAVGFTVKEIQDIPFAVDNVQYTSFWGNLAEVTYTGQNNTAVLRMASRNEDISGDYSEYANIKNYTTNGYDITLKGNNDKYNLAIWQYDGFSYAVRFVEAVSEQEMLTSIKSLQ